MPDENKIRSDKIKRTIRNLKKAEIRIRSQHLYGAEKMQADLVWSDFFDIRLGQGSNAKYKIDQIIGMSKQEYKEMVEEFYWNVYYRIYKNSYYSPADTYEIDAFAKLNLSPFADIEDIKARFRQLAKKYHPDKGGSSQEFIEIYKIYKELKDR
ncbi:MAG: J domain-containing protein [Eubacteriales bacterium]